VSFFTFVLFRPIFVSGLGLLAMISFNLAVAIFIWFFCLVDFFLKLEDYFLLADRTPVGKKRAASILRFRQQNLAGHLAASELDLRQAESLRVERERRDEMLKA